MNYRSNRNNYDDSLNDDDGGGELVDPKINR